jgi:hypothetical protein
MALIDANKNLTLAEVNKANGYVEAAELLGELQQRNEFLDEVPWLPSSHGSHNEMQKAKSLGHGEFTPANGATPIMASTSDIIKEPVRVYDADSDVPDKLLKGADDPRAARNVQDIENLEGFLQRFNSRIIYGNSALNPDEFKSLTERRNKLGTYCWSAGGTGTDLTSVWLFEMCRGGFFFTYNKHGSPGIKNEDKGIHRVNVPVGNGEHWVWTRHYEIWAGINVRNERALQRYCNIEQSGASSLFDPNVIIEMKAQLPSMGRNAVMFANRTIFGQIEQHAYNKVNAAYSIADIMGFGPVLKVAGVYVRPWESISEAESAVA